MNASSPTHSGAIQLHMPLHIQSAPSKALKRKHLIARLWFNKMRLVVNAATDQPTVRAK